MRKQTNARPLVQIPDGQKPLKLHARVQTSALHCSLRSGERHQAIAALVLHQAIAAIVLGSFLPRETCLDTYCGNLLYALSTFLSLNQSTRRY